MTIPLPIKMIEAGTEHCDSNAVTQFLIVMKPKKCYLQILPTYICTVNATDIRAAGYAAKRSNPRVFNNLDARYCDLVARCIEPETTYIV